MEGLGTTISGCTSFSEIMNSPDKTLLIITPGFPRDEQDTTCLPPIQSFVRSLNKNFPALKIIILALRFPYSKNPYQWHSNSVIPLDGNSRSRFALWISAYYTLKKILGRSTPIGVLNFWCLEAAMIGTFFARRKNLRNLIWIHGQDARKKNPYVKFIKPKPTELVALSEFLADEFANNHGVRPESVIPNGVDTSEFSKSPNERSIGLLGVGSLIPLKQYDVFLEVVSHLAQSHPNIKATLCGAGPEMNTLKEKIKTMRLERNISIRGELPHPDILEIMQRSKILLHPSSYEGYSTVCLEALYAGCHVVSFTKAEKRDIENWHIATDKTEMISISERLLANPGTFRPILVHDMNDTARSMLRLFNY